MNKKLKIVFALLYMSVLVAIIGTADQTTFPFLSGKSVEEEPIDLENCAVYFDGCNNCRIGNEGQMMCTRMFCSPEMKSQPKCLQFKDAQ